MSAVWQDADRRQPCVGFRTTYEDKVRGGKPSSRLAAETTDMRRKLVEKQAKAASLSERGLNAKKEGPEQNGCCAVLAVSGGVAIFFEDM